MFGIFKGLRPDITPAQVIGLAIPGIPVAAKFLEAFGVVTFSVAEQDALKQALEFGSIVAAGLFVGDAHIRNGRSQAAAVRDAAALQAQPAPAPPSVEHVTSAIRQMVATGELTVGGDQPAPAAPAPSPVPAEPEDLTPVAVVASPVEAADAPLEAVDADGEGLVDDATEFASGPPPLGAPADPDAR